MAKRIIWRSWSKLEAAFELDRIQHLPLEHQWVNGHSHQPTPNDVYLTTNGYDFKPGRFKKASLYAESYVYLNWEYDSWNKNQNKWDHRFHFNPYYAASPKTTHQNIGTWWKKEITLHDDLRKNKNITHIFGMVLGNKGVKPKYRCDFGPFRSRLVKEAVGRSFKYYGTKWPDSSQYGGEKYINGSRSTPIKFNDARRLMSNSKFVFAFENTYDARYSLNYLTEKIWHAFLSYSVPIYAGCWNVDKVIPANIFIDARKFNLMPNRIMDHCEKMKDSEYQGYLDRIGEFLHGPGQRFTCDEMFMNLDKNLTKIFG